jgi:hypothetical protein
MPLPNAVIAVAEHLVGDDEDTHASDERERRE